MASQSSAGLYEQGQRTADAVMESAQDYTETLTRHISRNPLTAVLVALGLGWLIGLMSNWR